MFKFLKLYRFDIFLITILLFLFGSFLANDFNIKGSNYLYNLLLGFLISAISINFIYSLNSWFDADVDKINKPERPIPAGLIKKSEAFIYSIFLGILALIYPFFLFFNNIKFLFLIFILVGVLYSNSIFSLKKNKYLSLISIIFIVILVFYLGYIINNGNVYENQFFINVVLLFLLNLSVLPLKDLTDICGDKIYGLDNWFISFSKNKILIFSIILLYFGLILSIIFFNIIFFIIYFSIILFFIFSLIFGFNLDNFYKKILFIFSFDGLFVLFLFYIVL
ncbi:UbiA family prenyltransferase [Candidatus Gracilibacteria bacterium]|nr:UbiA family prenyltransferase [Candidatus Gracilibacteria bacterium]